MANKKQTPPGLNASNVYMNAVSTLADLFEESPDQSSFKDSRSANIEKPDDWLRRDLATDVGVSIAFKKGGLVERKNKPKKAKTKLRADQQAFLEIAKRRRNYKKSKERS